MPLEELIPSTPPAPEQPAPAAPIQPVPPAPTVQPVAQPPVAQPVSPARPAPFQPAPAAPTQPVPPAPIAQPIAQPPVAQPTPPARPAPAPTVQPAKGKAQETGVLKLLAKGFDDGTEQRLLLGTVRMSRRRNPVLEIVDRNDWQDADVFIIDGKNSQAMSWARANLDALAEKAAIWVDTPALVTHHMGLSRPVQWVNLPILLSRALDEAAVAETEKQLEEVSQKELTSSMVQAFGTLLVVDDSLAVRNHLQSKLDDKGYTVTVAADGEEALLILKKQRFACILMDVLMPGMDGYDTCKKVKAMREHAATPVVMLTSRSSPFDKIRGKMAGCSAYLTKPVEMDQLLATLGKFIG